MTASPSAQFNNLGNHALVGGMVVAAFAVYLRQSSSPSMRPSEKILEDLNVVLPNHLVNQARPFVVPKKLDDDEDEWEPDSDDDEEEWEPNEPDYADLEFDGMEDEIVFSRRIDPYDAETSKYDFLDLLHTIDVSHLEHIYEPKEDLEDWDNPCQRTPWKDRRYPNCNSIHEFEVGRPKSILQDFNVKFLGSGGFRNAWLLDDLEPFVFKRLKLKRKIGFFQMHKIHRESIIMERLTASPRVIDIYGYCSTSIFSEATVGDVWTVMVPGTGRALQSDLDKLDDVYPRNDFTAEEKLDMSIEMAEALADLHGFEGGVIIHGDTHPEQWLRAKDGHLILNDFNNAEILDYHQTEDHYCKPFWDLGGFYRAPEEYTGMLSYIDEGIDTFALGNNFYCLLTGLWPFYNWTDYSIIQQKLLRKERTYVDPRWRTRSFIEGKLVEVMEETWAHNPDERISIFEVIDFLKQTKREHEASNLIQR